MTTPNWEKQSQILTSQLCTILGEKKPVYEISSSQPKKQLQKCLLKLLLPEEDLAVVEATVADEVEAEEVEAEAERTRRRDGFP